MALSHPAHQELMKNYDISTHCLRNCRQMHPEPASIRAQTSIKCVMLSVYIACTYVSSIKKSFRANISIKLLTRLNPSLGNIICRLEKVCVISLRLNRIFGGFIGILIKLHRFTISQNISFRLPSNQKKIVPAPKFVRILLVQVITN